MKKKDRVVEEEALRMHLMVDVTKTGNLTRFAGMLTHN